jgi:lipopolysaccharide/colanic/teichoic acid biosynthesis glycosyltransferase
MQTSAQFSPPVNSPARAELLSPWSRSRARRFFDIAVILAASPLLIPLAGIIALAVCVRCGFPILFRQTRAGRFGQPFTILKFRTMKHAPRARNSAIAAHAADEVTTIGRFLRRTKLDELPQAWNVLVGDMGLVGPRPKVPEQQSAPLDCRPGLTGAATLAFAQEERIFAQIPVDLLDDYYREVVLPAKQRLDNDYRKQATLLSDLRILRDTALGRWRLPSTQPRHAEPESAAQIPTPSLHEDKTDHARPANVRIAQAYSGNTTSMASGTASAGDC